MTENAYADDHAAVAADSPDRSKTITAIETIQLPDFPNLLWVQIKTSSGLTGLGETFFGSDAVASYIHETAAHQLLGRSALRITAHAHRLKGYVGYGAAGAETRGNSAIDIALWDLLGKYTGQPLYQLLGGATREAIKIYNTCAGSEYIRKAPTQSVDNWGVSHQPIGPYEDLRGFLERPAELAADLLDEGITGMKIWPLDPMAEASAGQYISAADLRRAAEPLRRIREAVGEQIDIMVEMHGLWNLPTARKICQAFDEFKPAWYEDPIPSHDLAALARLASSTSTPLAVSETLAGQDAFRRLMDLDAAGVVLIDVSWCGGISDAKQIAQLAAARQLPVALHDCTGPVVLATSVHMSVNLPNALIQESVRAYYRGWYTELAHGLPSITAGYATPTSAPGHGVALNDDIFDTARVRATSTSDR